MRETASMETPSALYGVCFWCNAFFIIFFSVFMRIYGICHALDILVIFLVSRSCSQTLGMLHICTAICVIPSRLMMWLCCQFRSQTPSVYLISCSTHCAAHPGLPKLPKDSPLHGSTARYSMGNLVKCSIWNMRKEEVIKHFRIWSEMKKKKSSFSRTTFL